MYQIWHTGDVDLNQAASDLFGETESRVLRALGRLNYPVSGRQLAILAGDASASTVQRYLHKLREIGLVGVTKTPSATLYDLNRRHVYWPPIEQLLAARTRVNLDIVELVEGELGPTARVAAFGSVANGVARPDSDYDLLVVVDESVSREERTRVATKIGDLIETVSGNEGHVIDVSAMELRELARHNSPLLSEWRRDARAIDGRGRIPQLGAES